MKAYEQRVEILERLRDRVVARDESGKFSDGDAVLEAVITAATLGLPMPAWLAGRVMGAISAYQNFEVRTLDEAFGVEREKGKRLHAEFNERQNAIYVIAEVLHLQSQGEPTDAGMFEVAGAACGVGKTTAEEWFYKHKNANTDVFKVAKQMAELR